ncbi:unnamed protein product [Polarella glacialis]|uniref:Ferredoxin n=1 Tax=Polarella glacialis TaxID=89957 RepID=A0A813LDP3_POLGL|nr:unnamed protein product [Polarella glacialis]
MMRQLPPRALSTRWPTARSSWVPAMRLLRPQPVAQQPLWPAPLSVGQGQLGERASSSGSGSSPPRPWVDREKADREKALAFVIERLLEQVVPPEDSEAVAAGVLDALSAPGSGLPAGMLLSVVTQMAGRWEVGEDAGLLSLAKSVEQELRASAGKLLVRFKVRPPRGGPAFDCEGLEGMSLKDVAQFGNGTGSDFLGELIECACGGYMACSTCHVYVDPAWFAAAGPPCDAEQDMLELAHDPRETSRLGCQLTLTPELDGMTITIPDGANNIFDDIPFK